MHKIYNSGLYIFGLHPFDHLKCNFMSSPKLENCCRYFDETSSIYQALCDNVSFRRTLLWLNCISDMSIVLAPKRGRHLLLFYVEKQVLLVKRFCSMNEK